MLMPFGVLVASDVVISIKRLATETITSLQMRTQMLVLTFYIYVFTHKFLACIKKD